MTSITKLAITCLLLTAAPWGIGSQTESESIDDLVIYTAKKIITMEPDLRDATAVAVANGRIVAVGSLKSLSSWTDQKNSRINRRFEGKVIMPGFIDPHDHT